MTTEYVIVVIGDDGTVSVTGTFRTERRARSFADGQYSSEDGFDVTVCPIDPYR